MRGKSWVGVVGGATTRFGELWEKSFTDIIVDSGIKALDDAQSNLREDYLGKSLTRASITKIFVANMSSELILEQKHTTAKIAEILGLRGVEVTKVEEGRASGSKALAMAIRDVETDGEKLDVAFGVEKTTDAQPSLVAKARAMNLDQEQEVFYGLTLPVAYQHIENLFKKRYGVTTEQIHLVRVKNQRHAVNNPNAQFKRLTPLSVVGKLPRHGFCDGSATVVLANRVEMFNNGAIVVGQGSVTGMVSLTAKEDPTRMESTREAMKIALAKAEENLGMEKDEIMSRIRVMEVDDYYLVGEMLSLVELGFLDPEEVGEAYSRAVGEHAETPEHLPDTIFLGGRYGPICVNPSGGCTAMGHPDGALGVAQAVEVYNQLMGKAGRRQVESDLGLTHNVGGVGGSCNVHIFAKKSFLESEGLL